MTWITDNWVFLLIGAAFIAFHLFGHRGHWGHGGHGGFGGHGGHGGNDGNDGNAVGRGNRPEDHAGHGSPPPAATAADEPGKPLAADQEAAPAASKPPHRHSC